MLDKKEKYNTIDGASVPACAFAERAICDLCDSLEIDRTKSKWRDELIPFVPVLVAMIAAASRDYEIEWAGKG
jgi:hypothetical protein